MRDVAVVQPSLHSCPQGYSRPVPPVTENGAAHIFAQMVKGVSEPGPSHDAPVLNSVELAEAWGIRE